MPRRNLVSPLMTSLSLTLLPFLHPPSLLLIPLTLLLGRSYLLLLRKGFLLNGRPLPRVRSGVFGKLLLLRLRNYSFSGLPGDLLLILFKNGGTLPGMKPCCFTSN